MPFVGLGPLLRSSTEPSMSSCLRRLLRPPLLFEVSDGRCGMSFGRGAGSESGDLDVLVEAEGAERLPERLVSLGESGGPIVAVWAMIPEKLRG